MRTSPPASSGGSPKAMIPPPNPFAIPLPGPRTIALTAPSLLQVGTKSPGYSSNSYSHSTSPSTASGSLTESQNHDTPSLIISPTQISSANLNAQKRAYRQRRKDPSCDACRERKVKCDATETSACSECSSRNHKCQFTKETNRRMSSIKQVQDLQSQIAELTQMNSQLRTKVPDQETLEPERTDTKRRRSEAQISTFPSPRRVPMPHMSDFEHVRRNVQKHSHGIFNTPHQGRPDRVESNSGLPEVPLRAEFAQLTRSYLTTIHDWYPALHWPTFQHEADEVYASRSFEGMSRQWIGLFFAILACGSLQNTPDARNAQSAAARGQTFFDIATQALTPWPQEFSMTHAQTALLLSIFAVESNQKSVGSMWLASAVRIAQELELAPEGSGWSAFDGEVRRRLWWAIYVRDRLTALETNKPTLIHENDCDISLPSNLEDRYIQPQGFFRSPTSSTAPTGSLAIISVTRLYADLLQNLKSSIVLPQVLQSFDDQFRSKLSLLPEAYQPESSAVLEITALTPLFTLLDARLHLYRRNLSPACRRPERSDALGRCTSIAQETAKYISRAIHNPPKLEAELSWAARVARISSNMVSMHLWRCLLVLCLSAEYEAALMCLHLAAAIGDTRKVNVSCGNNLIFFLNQVIDRVRSGRGNPQQLEHDEEIMAYASGDAQRNLDHSWIWSTDYASTISPQISPRGISRPPLVDEPMHDAAPLRNTSRSPENGPSDHAVWTTAEHLIRQLMEDSRLRAAQAPSYYPPPHNPVKRVHLAPEMKSPPKPTPSPSPAPSSTSRISIANII